MKNYEEREFERQREDAVEEIRSMLRENGGCFRFGGGEDCPSVMVMYPAGDAYPFRVSKVYLDEDDDIMLSGGDSTDEVWENEGLYNVVGCGIMDISDALRSFIRKDYIGLVDELREEMLHELWRVINAHKDDERCDFPRNSSEVGFEHERFCEVDLGGATYTVDKVSVCKWGNGCIRLDFMSQGLWYTLFDVEEIAGVLHAVRNTLDIPLKKEGE